MRVPDMPITSQGVILVMGMSGAGKSHFIDRLHVGATRIGNTLRSETSQCQAVQVHLDEDDHSVCVTVVDTPGFGDTERSDLDILEEIADYLTIQHASGIPLRGILFLHNITNNRIQKDYKKVLELFHNICGPTAMENVILVTTMWNRINDESRGHHLKLEDEFIGDYWEPMRRSGSINFQYDGTAASAYPLVLELVGRDPVTLDIQLEAVDMEKPLGETSAGQPLKQKLRKDQSLYQGRSSELGTAIQRIKRGGQQDRSHLKELEDEKKQADAMVSQLSRSLKRLDTDTGVRSKQRFKDLVGSRAVGPAFSGVSALAAILGWTLHFVLAGGM